VPVACRNPFELNYSMLEHVLVCILLQTLMYKSFFFSAVEEKQSLREKNIPGGNLQVT
jgi:hypothetical protein